MVSPQPPIPGPANIRRRIAAMRAQGRDIVDLASGEPDFPTPPHVVAAAHAAALRGETRYTDPAGTAPLRGALRDKLARENRIEVEPHQIVVTAGSREAIALAFMVTLRPDDEVLVPTPCWTAYLDLARLAGGKPVELPGEPHNDFKLQPFELSGRIGPRTRWLVLNSPCNPTGAVFAGDELANLAAMLEAWPNLLILSDDLYEHFVFDGRATGATLAGIAPYLGARILTVGGPSKTYAMTGWRIGYAAGPAWLVASIAERQPHLSSCPSSISQAAAIAALDGPPALLADRTAEAARRRDLFVKRIAAVPGLISRIPAGTFYAFVLCADLIGRRKPDGGLIANDCDLTDYLLDAAGVAVYPGSGCASVIPHLRFNFAACPPGRLGQAIDRIGHACAALA
jgi:aspartate aminotransferase